MDIAQIHIVDIYTIVASVQLIIHERYPHKSVDMLLISPQDAIRFFFRGCLVVVNCWGHIHSSLSHQVNITSLSCIVIHEGTTHYCTLKIHCNIIVDGAFRVCRIIHVEIVENK